MLGKFVTGMILAVIAVIITGGYFLKDSSKGPDLAPEIRDSLEFPFAKFKVALRAPGVLVPVFPEAFTIIAKLRGINNEGARVFVNLTNGRVEKNPNLSYSIAAKGPSVVPGLYRLSVRLCPGKDNEKQCSEGSGAFFDAIKWFKVEQNTVDLNFDLGTIHFTRWNRGDTECGSGSPLLTGVVRATPAFPSLPMGKKLALVILSLDNQNLPQFEFQYDNLIREHGSKLVYFNLPEPVSQYILYSGPLEARKATGFPFSAPYVPNYKGLLTLLAVECDEKDSYEFCAKKAFPVAANASSILGRYDRLIAKQFIFPSCGMRGVEFFLNRSPQPDVPNEISPPAGTPEEILNGVSFY